MHVFHGVVCHVWLYVCDAHYVYVHMVEVKELHVYWSFITQLIMVFTIHIYLYTFDSTSK